MAARLVGFFGSFVREAGRAAPAGPLGPGELRATPFGRTGRRQLQEQSQQQSPSQQLQQSAHSQQLPSQPVRPASCCLPVQGFSWLAQQAYPVQYTAIQGSTFGQNGGRGGGVGSVGGLSAGAPGAPGHCGPPGPGADGPPGPGADGPGA